jgi:N-acetyl-anhydromuramyl-L-alanine amidase AmpD
MHQRISRKLRAAAAGAAFVLVAGTLALNTPRQAAASPEQIGRDQAFDLAAQEFGVPESVLEAVSYAQTRWDAHPGEHNTDGGYGPMNLIDGTLFADDLAKDAATPAQLPARVDSLGRAARLLGARRDQLRNNPMINIRGGSALLAQQQRRLGLPTGADSDPATWYAAVAASSGAADRATAKRFADDVYAVLADGAERVADDGTRVSMAAVELRPQQDQLRLLKLRTSAYQAEVECPRSLKCESIPAPYEKTGDGEGDYGNHDHGYRDTEDGPSVDYIVLHDTEGSWQTALQLVQDPTYIGWHYTIRSNDGHIAQHIPTEDIGWHAGNWYLNQHSIGIEQEGFAAEGATWYTESLYRNSARLVRHLAEQWDIPLDPAHILGHDNVPAINAEAVPDMHWDPGPYWDWEHYFDLLGAPLDERKGRPSSDIVRILPGFADNHQPITGCTEAGDPCPEQGSNFVYLYAEPSTSAPLVTDIGLRPDGSPSTTEVADIGARAVAGQEYAVAERRRDWIAVWYLGQKAWLPNPHRNPKVIPVGGWLVKPKQGKDSVTTYGRAYPESAAYPEHVPDQGTEPLPYKINSGQSAVLTDRSVSTGYYRAVTFDTPPPKDHIQILGKTRYLQVSIGHRVAFVNAADVDIVRAEPAKREPLR